MNVQAELRSCAYLSVPRLDLESVCSMSQSKMNWTRSVCQDINLKGKKATWQPANVLHVFYLHELQYHEFV